MGTPDRPEEYVRLQAEDLTLYLARDIWERLTPGEALLVGVSGYGRFRLQVEGR